MIDTTADDRRVRTLAVLLATVVLGACGPNPGPNPAPTPTPEPSHEPEPAKPRTVAAYPEPLYARAVEAGSRSGRAVDSAQVPDPAPIEPLLSSSAQRNTEF